MSAAVEGVELKNGIALKSRLLALPTQGFNRENDTWWDAILIVPSRKMHDSGFAHIAVIGVEWIKETGEIAREILGWPDDISFPPSSGTGGLRDYPGIRMDAYHPSGILRLWSNDFDFSFFGGSSGDIKIRKKEEDRGS